MNIIIPTDLAEIFFKLNEAVRKQCNNIIKPNLETELSEKVAVGKFAEREINNQDLLYNGLAYYVNQ